MKAVFGFAEALVLRGAAEAVPEETLPLTPILIIGHPLSASSIYD